MLSNCERFELFCPENLKQTNLYLSLKHKVEALFLLKSQVTAVLILKDMWEHNTIKENKH